MDIHAINSHATLSASTECALTSYPNDLSPDVACCRVLSPNVAIGDKGHTPYPLQEQDQEQEQEQEKTKTSLSSSPAASDDTAITYAT